MCRDPCGIPDEIGDSSKGGRRREGRCVGFVENAGECGEGGSARAPVRHSGRTKAGESGAGGMRSVARRRLASRGALAEKRMRGARRRFRRRDRRSCLMASRRDGLDLGACCGCPNEARVGDERRLCAGTRRPRSRAGSRRIDERRADQQAREQHRAQGGGNPHRPRREQGVCPASDGRNSSRDRQQRSKANGCCFLRTQPCRFCGQARAVATAAESRA